MQICVFFFSASAPEGSKYDRHSQWNELTLTIQLLSELWSQLLSKEKVFLLKIAGKIQADPNKAPSDCCMFVSNMTLWLFVRISFFYPLPGTKPKPKKYEEFLLAIAKSKTLPWKKQLITESMINALDPRLCQCLFSHDEKFSPSELFNFK
jgi:hypothetical protein